MNIISLLVVLLAVTLILVNAKPKRGKRYRVSLKRGKAHRHKNASSNQKQQVAPSPYSIPRVINKWCTRKRMKCSNHSQNRIAQELLGNGNDVSIYKIIKNY